MNCYYSTHFAAATVGQSALNQRKGYGAGANAGIKKQPAKHFRVLVTDSSFKHAIALARYLKRDIPDLHITGHTGRWLNLGSMYSCFDETISNIPLERAIRENNFEMLIPVGANSVLSVSRLKPSLAVLPSVEQLEISYDKASTIRFALNAGVPVPKTQVLVSVEQIVPQDITYPCVVKASREGVNRKVTYCHNLEETRRAVREHLAVVEIRGASVLVQEFVPGEGYGLFALMDHGRAVRVFMHHRLREDPPTGGQSTAARAYFSEQLKEYGLRLLQALRWHGAAMVEFKLDSRSGQFVLMEINGKFWGSLELALRSGVNFGADLVRLYRGETLQYCQEYDRQCHFYWPLDSDLRTIWRTRNFSAVRDYFKPDASTNVGQSLRADILKTGLLLWRLVQR